MRAAANDSTAAAIAILRRRPMLAAQADTEVAPLMMAASRGNVMLCAQLLAAGADPNESNGYGRRALHTAATHGSSAVVWILLLAGADAEAVDARGHSAARIAAAKGNRDALRILRNHETYM